MIGNLPKFCLKMFGKVAIGFKTNSASTYICYHKVLHALLGCAVGAAKSGDCASCAFGGVVGEIIGEEIANNTNISDKWVSATTHIVSTYKFCSFFCGCVYG